ncbi:DNA-binding transcriptional regulator, LysR family [Celeribacter neptunius]|uniref:DNA-binding transcriptional regulator, LysR family n=2 Tax=Celeribacter neptunius TaxID=588602 RepID=A0A1I3K9A0_9RHOB|nr:DNA-binding transcriptional regulator, LysR family [Celeribacter neptunius]
MTTDSDGRGRATIEVSRQAVKETFRPPGARLPLVGLRAVEAVLRLGNLNAAADELCVTPGAISQQVIKVEAQLGVRLFRRTPQGLEPTKTARKLENHLHAGFRELARAVALAQPTQSNGIAISAPPVFAAKWLVWRLHRFTEGQDKLKISIEATTDFADLDDQQIDACIRVGKGDWAGTRAIPLADIRVFPVFAPAFADRIRTPADLLNVPIIRDAGSGFDWNHWLRPNGMDAAQLADGPSYSDASLCLDAAIAGQGAFLSWETLSHDALRMGRLHALPGRFRTGSAYWFVESAQRSRSKLAQRFLRLASRGVEGVPDLTQRPDRIIIT